MTLTADHPARANRDGRPCPSWCITDHDEELVPGVFAVVHSTDPLRTEIGAHDSGRISGCLPPSTGILQIHVSGPDEPLFVPAAKAEGLAGLVELLAAATPEQHRELAAAIRQAAAVITETGNG